LDLSNYIIIKLDKLDKYYFRLIYNLTHGRMFTTKV